MRQKLVVAVVAALLAVGYVAGNYGLVQLVNAQIATTPGARPIPVNPPLADILGGTRGGYTTITIGSGLSMTGTVGDPARTLSAAGSGVGSVTGVIAGDGAGNFHQGACAELTDDGTACTANTGTSAHTLGFLDGNNTTSGNNTHSGIESFTNGAVNITGAPNGILKVTSGSVGSGGASTDLSDSANLPRLNTQNTYTKSNGVTPVALTPGTTVSVDASLSNNFTLTPAQNFTMSNPTNRIAGMTLNFQITQDGTGSRVVTWDTAYRAPAGVATGLVLSTAANAVDFVTCLDVSGTGATIDCTITKAYSH